MTEEKLLNTIRALLNKAEGTDNEHEAHAFLAKAQEMMLQHAIDEAKVRASGGNADRTPARTTINFVTGSPGLNARILLLHEVGKMNRCQVIVSRGHRSRYGGKTTPPTVAHMFGFADDLEFVELLFTSLLVQMESTCEREWSREGKLLGVNGRTWKTNFRNGFYNSVSRRLREAKKTSERTLAPAGSENALVLLSDVEKVAAEVRLAFPVLRSSRYALQNGAGGAAGNRAGRNADISGGRNHLGSQKALG